MRGKEAQEILSTRTEGRGTGRGCRWVRQVFSIFAPLVAGTAVLASGPSAELNAPDSLHRVQKVAAHQSSVDLAATMAAAAGIGAYLDREGYLSLPDGFTGNLNPAGFGMVLDPGGTPRFVSEGRASVPDSRWDDRFYLDDGCDGSVLAIATGSDGELYLGGAFSSCGGVPANRIVRFDPGTATWSALGSGGGNGVSGVVYALAVSGDDLYVGGEFTEANIGSAINANHIARWNGSAWSALGAAGGNGTSATVHALAISGGDLYVGGDFLQANVGTPQLVNRIARWDGSEWSALGSNGGLGVNGTVRAIAAAENKLFVGGVFTQANVGAPLNARNIAHWDGSGWSALGSGGGNGVNQQVNALAIVGSDLFVGGSFSQTNVGAIIRANNIARWDGSAWSPLASGTGDGVGGSVAAMIATSDGLYVGGSFSQANIGAAISVGMVAHWDGIAWSSLNGDSGNGVNLPVHALSLSDDNLYVGGSFTQANAMGTSPITATRIARWKAGVWSALYSGGNGMSGQVHALVVAGDDLYVGGRFLGAGELAANRIARWNGSTWSTLGTGGGNGVNGPVYALAVSGSDLYVGGNFTEVNVGAAIAANNIARWDGHSWSAVGSGSGNGVNGIVLSLLSFGKELYVAGNFSEVNLGESVAASSIARWSNEGWSVLGSGGGNGVSGGVAALAVFQNDLYVGGGFFQVNVGEPIEARFIARWDGSRWWALSSNGGVGTNSNVTALAVAEDYLYVGGHFSSVNGVAAARIARWDGATWSALGSEGGNGLNGLVTALAVADNDLYAAGYFDQANGGVGLPVNFLARWNGSNWSAVGGGTNGIPQALAAKDPHMLYVGGSFQQAGNRPSNYLGRYTTHGTLVVSLEGGGGGSVASNPKGLSCPEDCSAAFSWDQLITLTAVSDANSEFVGWSGGGCSGAAPCTLDLIHETSVSATFERVSFTIGGTLGGLVGDQVALQINGSDDLVLEKNGVFTFATSLPDLALYEVAVLSSPTNPSQTCTVANGIGQVAGDDVSDINVTCTTVDFTIGGTVSGLKGGGLVLRNNGGDDLLISADGPFTFAIAIPDLSVYEVTVHTQPSSPDQQCSISDGSGIVNGGAVTSVLVSCEALGIETTSTLLPLQSPPRAGPPISIMVQVAAASAPTAGMVTVLASTGESCDSATPQSIGFGMGTWSCELSFSSLGPRSLTASYSGSPGYQPSSSLPLSVVAMRHADVAVWVDDGVPAIQPGSEAYYLLRIENHGPDAAPSTALVTDAVPPLLTPLWSCVAFGSAACPAPGGVGLPIVALDLPAGSGMDFLVEGVFDAPLPLEILVAAEATVSSLGPNFVHDPFKGNNHASDQNVTDLIFRDGLELF